MRPETGVPVGDRAFMIVGRLGDSLIHELDAKCIPEFLDTQQKRGLPATDTTPIEQYFNRDRSQDNAYFTLYAYADVKRGQKFSQLLHRDGATQPIKTECTIEHIIYESWFPTSVTERGHKHFLFLKFKEAPPSCITTFDTWDELVRAKWIYGLSESEIVSDRPPI